MSGGKRRGRWARGGDGGFEVGLKVVMVVLKLG